MSITFTWGTNDPTVPQYIVSKTSEPKRPYGSPRLVRINEMEYPDGGGVADGSFDGKCCVEIRRGAYTDEELAEIDAKAELVGTNGKSSAVMALKKSDYGIRWRVWSEGWPSDELMVSTPWEPYPEEGGEE